VPHLNATVGKFADMNALAGQCPRQRRLLQDTSPYCSGAQGPGDGALNAPDQLAVAQRCWAIGS
jgi:hypothetical protein